jgi:hypothetical protein
VLCAGGAGVAFRHYFSSDRIITQVRSAVKGLTGADLQISQVEWSTYGTLIFHDLILAGPAAGDPKPEADQGLSTLMTAKTVTLVLSRTGLLTFRFKPKDVLIDGLELHLSRRSELDRWNWQHLFDHADQTTQPTRRFGVGPSLRMHNAKILVADGKGELREKMSFSAEALPRKDVYHIQVRLQPPSGQGPEVSFDFAPRTGKVLTGNMPPTDVVQIEQILPQPYREFSRRLDVAGNVSIGEMDYLARDEMSLVFELDGVRARIPVSSQEWDNPDLRWFLNFSDLSGRVALSADAITFDRLTGRVNGAPCELYGAYRRHTDEFNLRIVSQGYVSPDYLDADDREMIETQLPRKLRNFFHDFKPHGKFNVDLAISRTLGPDGTANTSLSGTCEADHASAEFREFPYRLDDLTGTVILANGGFKLKGIQGRSNGSRIDLEGTISEPSRNACVELRITADQLALDEKLRLAMPDRYKRIWEMFSPSGRAKVGVSLFRPAGPEQPWDRKIDAELLDARLCYENFKYPIERLSGKLAIANHHLQIHQLRGRHGEGTVCLGGEVNDLESPHPTARIQVQAENIPIDETLVQALPPPAAKMINDCRLAGLCDLTGLISVPPDGNWDYHFVCDLKDASVRCQDFPYPVEGLNGRLVINPDRVDIEHVLARKDSRVIQARGQVDLAKENPQVTMTVDAANVPIDATLFDVLNARQQAVWQSLSPKGKIDLHAELSRSTGATWDWKCAIHFDQTSIQYGTLPKVGNLRGALTFDGNEAILENITGTTEQGAELSCTGKINLTDKATHAQLALGIKDLPITQELLDTLGAGKLVSILKWRPGGRMSCQLHPLTIAVPQDVGEHAQWSLDGTIELADASIDACADPPVNLTFKGASRWISGTDQFALDGIGRVSRFVWKSLTVTDASCRTAKILEEPKLKLTDLRGQVGTGELAGAVELEFLPEETSYGLQVTLQDVPTENILAFGLSTTRPKPVSGKVRCEISLIGKLDEKYPTRGGGSIAVSEADLFNIPLFADVYRAVNQEPPNMASFHNVSIDFILDNHIMDLRRIELEGSPLPMLGFGAINLSNQRLKLDLIVASSKQFKKVPLLRDLLQRANEDLTEVEITGTLNDPVIKPTPLRQFSGALGSFMESKRTHQPPAQAFPPP